MLEKDNTNSGLNSFQYRHQNVFIANVYRQDFLWHGYTIQASVHYDVDDASLQYDTNNFLVRPAPVGVVQPHKIRTEYYGLTGDGHIGRLNLTHAFYEVLGKDSLNPIAGREVRVNAQMAAAELSLDREWLRYRVSFFYASSGDTKIRKAERRLGLTASSITRSSREESSAASGIVKAFDSPAAASRSTSPDIRLITDFRSSKIEGQANYVNPGLFLYNGGIDADVTPRLRAFLNLNLIRFADTEPLEQVLFPAAYSRGSRRRFRYWFHLSPQVVREHQRYFGVQRVLPFPGLSRYLLRAYFVCSVYEREVSLVLAA